MFIYDTYGTNIESVIQFNEYPPFTAIFQYLFLKINEVYREDIIIVAQNMLYLSIVIPITKNINWDKSLKKLITIVPIIIFVPMIFYKDFYLNILVDGILGIMFAYVIFSALEKENTIFKYIKILAGEIMLCLTKTSGIGLAVLLILIILIKLLIDRKEKNKNNLNGIKYLAIVVVITALVTAIWYIKTKETQKRWDFNQYMEVQEQQVESQESIIKKFIYAIFFKDVITERKFTVLTAFFLLISLQIYTLTRIKDRNYKYYSIAVAFSIPIYLIGLLVTYSKIFDIQETQMLTSFERYISTILLAYTMFQMMTLSQIKYNNHINNTIVILSIILALIPISNIQKKYIEGKDYIITSNINRDIYTKLKRYKDILIDSDKILYICDSQSYLEYIKAINEYEIMPIKIEQIQRGSFVNQQTFEELVKKYNYVYIYRIDKEEIEVIKETFQHQYVKNDTLYKVNKNEEEILLEIVI